MRNFKNLMLFLLVITGFYISCSTEGKNSPESQSPGSDEQFFGKRSASTIESRYAHTLTGTGITHYTKAYLALEPSAQQIIRAHEEIHQQQNPFMMSAACREVPAYQLQLLDSTLWLLTHNGDKRFDKEANEVRLLGLAPNLVDFSKTLSNFVVQLCAGESQRGRTRIDKAKR